MCVLYAGCSFTSGVAFGEIQETNNSFNSWQDCKDSKYIWPNLIHEYFFSNYRKNNIAEGGNTNLRIFQQSALEIITGNYKFAFIQWTSLIRYQYELGFELYSTRQTATIGEKAFTHYLNDGTYYAEELEKRQNRFFTLEHDQYKIVELLKFINILFEIAKLKNTKIYFVNGLLPWDNNFFDTNKNNPESFTEYTKKLLNLNTRDDEELLMLYNKMQNQYKNTGGIQYNNWLNLYKPMNKNKIDTAKDDMHHGILSHKNYFKEFAKKLESVLQ